jgi:putative membrane protein
METESLNTSLDKAKKHYSSMFSLPSLRNAFFSIVAICAIGISLAVFVLFPSISSVLLGVALFVFTVLADLIISKIVLAEDSIFTTRRTLVLSVVGWLFWFLFLFLGVGLSYLFDWLIWVKLSLVGYCVVLTLRTIVFTATSTSTIGKQLISIFLQPALCIVAFLVFWINISTAFFGQILLVILLMPILAYATVFILLNSINSLGKNALSLPALPLFKAFLLNWVNSLNEPLENFLEEIGEDSTIEVSLLKFDSSKPKAAIILPLVHPGPFKNIGSSLLPSLLKHEFERKFSCTACVPLGILGHELDLASQIQNQKIISKVISSVNFEATSNLASPSVRVQEGIATTTCQIFGDSVFVSFSLAPKTTEDLPQELGRFVSEEAKKYGLKYSIVVNAHNSLTEVMDTDQNVAALHISAAECLKQAVGITQAPFRVGSATVYANEFSLKQGMGDGGITALVIEVAGQKTVYVVIDGNNMISGLRERVLSSLGSLGFDQSEVFTTDTHSVSALVTGKRGYHPLGEVMDQDILIKRICEASKKAEDNLELVKAGCRKFVVPNVRVIGEDHLGIISSLVDKAIARAKHLAVPVFGLEGLILLLLMTIF